jgi:hypothetical protein
LQLGESARRKGQNGQGFDELHVCCGVLLNECGDNATANTAADTGKGRGDSKERQRDGKKRAIVPI